MMRALFSGVTGLRTHQTKMDVIGNNISNVNTMGYKKSQANFADIYSETVSPASAPSARSGGVNAKQVGLGVQLASIQIKHNPGAAQYTGNTLDVAISGDGFFAVRTDADGKERYTRAGNLSISSNGSLVTSAGNFVQCFKSSYVMGDSGVASTSGYGTAANPKKATGIANFTFTPDNADISSMPSGTYTVEMADSNTSVILMKNGVQVGEPIPIMVVGDIDDETGTPKKLDSSGFKASTTYSIDLSSNGLNLGQIRFTTDPHKFTTNAASAPAGFGDGEFTTYVEEDGERVPVPTATLNSIPTGEYQFTVDATTGQIGFKNEPPEAGADQTALELGELLITAENGTTDIQWGAAIEAGSTITIPTNAGTFKYTVTKAISAEDSAKKVMELVESISLKVSAGSAEGADNFATGLASLNGLLTGSSIAVSNNDAFTSTAMRGDMIINEDLFENISIGDDGSIVGQLKRNVTGTELASEAGILGAQDMSAGEKVVLGYVALATFSNYEGLEKVGTNLYEMTQNSGRPMYTTPGSGGSGVLASSSLEMSNVDLSEEMVNMITTQRGFQANSRIITTTDTMLEELINLKR